MSPTWMQTSVDKRYATPVEPLHIVGAEWNLSWYEGEVEKAIKLYNGGHSLTTIARRLDSYPRDVFLLLMDLAEAGRIKRRAGWLWGVQ